MTNKTNIVLYKHNKDIIRLLLLALTAFYCTLPLFTHQGLPYAHDIDFHIFQANQFNQAIHDGVFYPRWVLDSNNGYGSPNFVFYSPLSYYFVSLINIIVPSLIFSMVIAIWFSFFLSGITMFITSNKIFGRSGSLLSAVIYQILPFHLLDLYTRGTFAELFAFIWFPLIILFIHETLEKKTKTASIGLCISYAGLILTHLMSGFIFTFVIGTYLIYNYFLLKDKKPLLKTLLSLILGLGLSSFYLIPVIFERKFVQIEYIVTCPVGNYKKNFLFTWDKVQTVLQSFCLSMHIGVVLEAMLLIVIILLILNNRDRLSYGKQQGFFILLFLLAFFLTTPLSRPVWDFMPFFPTIQFPWRWVPVMELSLCLLLSSVFSDRSSLKSSDLKKRAVIYLLITLALVSLITILKSRPLPEEFSGRIVNAAEYTPLWATNMQEILSEVKNERVSVLSGLAQSHVDEWKSEKRVINIKASSPALLRISTFYYPGWEARINGRNIPIIIENKSGAMLIDIPRGEYTLELRFVNTSLRRFSRIISLASLVIVAFLAIIQKRF